jgi:hypothetical protein
LPPHQRGPLERGRPRPRELPEQVGRDDLLEQVVVLEAAQRVLDRPPEAGRRGLVEQASEFAEQLGEFHWILVFGVESPGEAT